MTTQGPPDIARGCDCDLCCAGVGCGRSRTWTKPVGEVLGAPIEDAVSVRTPPLARRVDDHALVTLPGPTGITRTLDLVEAWSLLQQLTEAMGDVDECANAKCTRITDVEPTTGLCSKCYAELGNAEVRAGVDALRGRVASLEAPRLALERSQGEVAAPPSTLELRSPHVWDVDANDGRGPRPRGVVHRLELSGDELVVVDVGIDEDGREVGEIGPRARIPFTEAVHVLQNTTRAERRVLATYRSGPPAEVVLEQLTEREPAAHLSATEVDLDRAVLGGELAALQAMGRLLESLGRDDRERLEGIERARVYRAHAMGLAAHAGPGANEARRANRIETAARLVVAKASLYVDDPLQAEHAQLARVLEEKA